MIMRRWSTLALAASLLAVAACSGGDGSVLEATSRPGGDTAMVPLPDLGPRTYLGSQGGLYPGGLNDPPTAHAAAGRAAAAAIVPLGRDGQPGAGGRIVLLSVGMSNTTMEFCSGNFPQCGAWTFAGQAAADPAVNHSTLVIVDGARGGQTTSAWASPALPQYDSANARLARAGVTESQVQVVWLKQANPQPTASMPGTGADAYLLEKGLGDVVRALKNRYPNLKQVFLSSRIYGGYASTTLNPEPYAYEGGFAVKWLIEAQINQMQQATAGTTLIDGRAGNLSYDGVVPWLAWGPYLWANGAKPRADGLVWLPQDYQADGTHPGQSGQQKVGKLLLDFFETSPFTRCWFLAGQRCS